MYEPPARDQWAVSCLLTYIKKISIEVGHSPSNWKPEKSGIDIDMNAPYFI